MEAGEIVGVTNDGKISKNTLNAHHCKVISTAPIVLGNWQGDDKKAEVEKVAFLGQVPVKILGKVQAGDYIIPSGKNDGTGIAVSPKNISATNYQKIVGIAWESSENEGLKKINVAIGQNNHEKIIGDLMQTIESQQTKMQSLEKRLEALEKLLTNQKND